MHSLWQAEIAPRLLPDASAEDTKAILSDAIKLLANQGELFLSSGMIFLDPSFATELLKPLVDHRLLVDEKSRETVQVTYASLTS